MQSSVNLKQNLHHNLVAQAKGIWPLKSFLAMYAKRFKDLNRGHTIYCLQSGMKFH